MLDEKKNEAIELTDGELDSVSGGSSASKLEAYRASRVSADDTCSSFSGSGEALCKNCKYAKGSLASKRSYICAHRL
jgi:hypothetical protein